MTCFRVEMKLDSVAIHTWRIPLPAWADSLRYYTEIVTALDVSGDGKREIIKIFSQTTVKRCTIRNWILEKADLVAVFWLKWTEEAFLLWWHQQPCLFLFQVLMPNNIANTHFTHKFLRGWMRKRICYSWFSGCSNELIRFSHTAIQTLRTRIIWFIILDGTGSMLILMFSNLLTPYSHSPYSLCIYLLQYLPNYYIHVVLISN